MVEGCDWIELKLSGMENAKVIPGQLSSRHLSFESVTGGDRGTPCNSVCVRAHVYARVPVFCTWHPAHSTEGVHYVGIGGWRLAITDLIVVVLECHHGNVIHIY